MPFETQRLILRNWNPTQDARHAMDIFGDAKVMQWVDPNGEDASIRQVQNRLQGYVDKNRKAKSAAGSWAVVQKDIGRVIGHVILMSLPDIKEVRSNHVEAPIEGGLPTDYIEIGWHFRPASWGYGYASEAARCIMRYAFEEWNLPMLLAVTHPDNQRSVAVMERIGMHDSGVTTRLYGGQLLRLYELSGEAFFAQTLIQPPSSQPTNLAQ